MSSKALALLQTSSGLTAKSDGKDKVLATIQYLLMFLSGGNPGKFKDMQVKVAAARKVFRFMKPLDSLHPVIREPFLPGKKPLHVELLPKLRSLFMASYFSFDHLVWFGSVSLIQDKKLLERFQKTSLWSWLLGSMSTIALEVNHLTDGSLTMMRQDGEDHQEWEARKSQVLDKLQRTTITLTHAVLQAFLAVGLLQLQPIRPRVTATFGVMASALNCYMMLQPPPVARKPPAKLT